MRLEKATWHNMGPFGDWSLDLTELEPAQKLVALVGVNGRGKSFCMESAVSGACYRSMPTQGTVSGRATAADSWQQSTIVHAGHRYRIKHLVNASTQKRSSETLVTDENGKPVYEGGTGVKLFEGWAATHLPDPDVLFASLFSAQQSEGFVKMTSGDRIGVILRVIGVARYERMAALARKRRDEQAEKLDQVTKRIADIRGDGLTAAQAEQQLLMARETVADFEAQVNARRAALAAATEADAAARVVIAQREAAVRELAALREQLDEAVEKRDATALKVKNNRALLAEADKIRGAVAEIARLQGLLVTSEQELAVAKGEADAALAPWLDVNERLAAIDARAARAKARAKDAAAVEAAKVELPALRDSLAEAEGEVSRLTTKLEELQAAHIAGAGERLAGALAAIESAHNMIDERADQVDVEDVDAVLVEALGNDQAAVALAKQNPIDTKETKERLAAARDRLAAAQRQVTDAERLAARSAEVDAAAAELAEAAQEGKALLASYSEAGLAAKAKVVATSELAAKSVDYRSSIARLTPDTVNAKYLDEAEARLAAYAPVLASQEQDVARLEAAVAAVPALPEEPKRPDLPALTAQLERTQGLLRFEQDGIARLEQSLEAAKVLDAKVADLEAERAAAQAEVAICARLSLDLGRTGLQSAEVDSAGPELTELVNDLLRTCHGPRFTVSVDTQRLTSDGKKTVDECLISVIDTEKGTEKEVREHSGGERVILGEAISLALTMLACRRAGFDRPTLFRDESAAALDPANARAWVAMMRRAVELTGADRLLFVSHSPEVVEMADAQIPVGEPAAVEARAA